MLTTLALYVHQNVTLKELLRRLVEYNYSSCAEVSSEGDYSQRGGVIDVYPVTFENPVRIELMDNTIRSIRSFDLISGNTLEKHTSAIILSRHIFESGRVRKNYLNAGSRLPINNFVDIEVGDCVVHLSHGIGKYLGIKKLRREKEYLDYLVIEYADNDKLYVPTDQLHLLSKYIAFSYIKPKLSKLGTKVWQGIKNRTKEGILSSADELLKLQAKRLASKGFSFSKDDDWQRQLEKEFPYQDTPDQSQTSEEVKADMQSSRPMDRLICGDVGYGKTEVAIRAAFKAVLDNKQVAILVPTTILAQQHFYTFTQRLRNFPVAVEMLSRFRTPAEQKMTICGITKGTVDIVIGTHRLLSADIKFKDLGLVIIDEEQRFGVRHKEKLKRLRALVDVLTLTATPIPRTLYMSLMGARDMSVINTPPAGRVPIQTRVCEYDDELIKKAITKEIKRGGQCYFIHNRVKDIEKLSCMLEHLIPQARICFAHGQMPEKQLEKIMLKFIQGDIDVLVATVIIQSGIDIPRANTLIVSRADLFGLTDLYQLRGRVGRFKDKAYAYFLLPKGFAWTDDARRRLKAIQKHTALGSGFKIAMEDLQIRGAGNLLGSQQHGFITAIGFDFYCRLLRESISKVSQNEKTN